MQEIWRAVRATLCAIGVVFLVTLAGSPVQAEDEAAPETETIELENGDKVQVTVIERTDDGIVADHPVFGRITIPNAQIKVETPEPINPGLFGSAFLRGWERSASFGFNGSSGNSDSIGINAGVKTLGEGDWYRARFRAQYFYAKQRTVTELDKKKTTNNAFVDYRQDFLIFGDSPFFLFGNARYDFDEFQDFRHRFAGQGGAGYDFFDNDTIFFSGNVGLGVNYSAGPIGKTIGEFAAGLDFRWNLFEGQSITADTYYYADIQRWTDFRLLSSLLYEISLGFVDGLALNAGLKNEFRNEVTAPVLPDLRNDRNNLQYYGGLSYDF